jgi:hypothetical protein
VNLGQHLLRERLGDPIYQTHLYQRCDAWIYRWNI